MKISQRMEITEKYDATIFKVLQSMGKQAYQFNILRKIMWWNLFLFQAHGLCDKLGIKCVILADYSLGDVTGNLNL